MDFVGGPVHYFTTPWSITVRYSVLFKRKNKENTKTEDFLPSLLGSLIHLFSTSSLLRLCLRLYFLVSSTSILPLSDLLLIKPCLKRN